MVTSLSRADVALTGEEIVAFLRRRVGDHLLEVTTDYETLTLYVDAEGYVESARVLAEDDRLAFSMFDCLFGIDAREEGFDIVAILYSVETGRRVTLRHRCEGGREAPIAPTLTDIYHGANFHEREAWDMFGIEFTGHPGLAPRILCAENFEGWPLRKDFHLASREAKPWPGVKEPAELDEDGNVIERIPGPGDAAGPTALDEAMAAQARAANPGVAPDEVAEPEPGSEPAASVEADAAGSDDAPEARTDEASSRARADDQRRSDAEARTRKALEREAADAETPDEADTDGDDDVVAIPQGDQSVLGTEPESRPTDDESPEAGA